MSLLGDLLRRAAAGNIMSPWAGRNMASILSEVVYSSSNGSIGRGGAEQLEDAEVPGWLVERTPRGAGLSQGRYLPRTAIGVMPLMPNAGSMASSMDDPTGLALMLRLPAGVEASGLEVSAVNPRSIHGTVGSLKESHFLQHINPVTLNLLGNTSVSMGGLTKLWPPSLTVLEAEAAASAASISSMPSLALLGGRRARAVLSHVYVDGGPCEVAAMGSWPGAVRGNSSESGGWLADGKHWVSEGGWESAGGMAWVMCLGVPPGVTSNSIDPVDVTVSYSVFLDGCSVGTPHDTAVASEMLREGVAWPANDLRCIARAHSQRQTLDSTVSDASVPVDNNADHTKGPVPEPVIPGARGMSGSLLVGHVDVVCTGCVRYLQPMDVLGNTSSTA